MAAVIRLKRRFEDEPLNALVLNCKKRKIGIEDKKEELELSTLLKFAGTFQNQEDDVFTHLKKPSKTEFEEQFKKHNIDISAKLRAQKQADSKSSRFKIVNCLRSKSSNFNESADNKNDSEFTVYDIEVECDENHEDNCEKVTKYVYDLYYTTSDDLGDAYLEDYVSMYPYNEDLIFGSMRDNGLNQPDSEDDSDDSNAESNWRNDYPDESDIESITEDDMLQAMQKCDLNDLSSDNEEENCVYNINNDTSFYNDDDDDDEDDGLEDSDVERYGKRYARFKAKHNNEGIETTTFKPDFYYGDIDVEGY